MISKRTISGFLLVFTIAIAMVVVTGGSIPNACAGGTTGTGTASTVAEQPCDPKYYKSLAARAWLEAEREIIQNQNLIFKPDSVMEYVCFDNFVRHNAQHAGDIFVHTTYFGKIIIARGGATSMEGALNKVVGDALKSYMDTNYKSAFLADRSKHLSGAPQGPSSFNGISVGSYSCDYMAKIWQAAKCINFIDNKAFEMTDGFYPIKSLKAGPGQTTQDSAAGYDELTDPRQWPEDMKCPGPGKTASSTAGGAATASSDALHSWEKDIPIAENTPNDSMYPFKTPLGKAFTDVRKMVEPGQCEKAVETGVTVYILSDNTTYKDGVCTNPGCTYKKGSSSSVGTCE